MRCFFKGYIMKLFKSLASGKYKAYSNLNARQVKINGGFSGDAVAICEKDFVTFYKGDKVVFTCNPIYANANFKCTKIKE